MIVVNGYKAYNGVMKITPKTKCVSASAIEGDWFYNPSDDCWHGKKGAYPAELCTIVRDNTQKEEAKKLLPEHRYYGIGMCPTCGVVFKSRPTNHCGNCGQKLERGE